MTSPGWTRTVAGRDVYTDDGEWWFDHQTQGWYYEPDLAVMPPQAPAGARARSWWQRMRTPWPNVFGGLLPWNTPKHLTGTLDWVLCWLLRGLLVWMWVWKIGLDWGLANVYLSVKKGLYVMGSTAFGGPSTRGCPWVDGEGSALGDYDCWWEQSNTDFRNFVGFGLIVLVTLCCIYLLYLGYLETIDPEKARTLVIAQYAIHGLAAWRRAQSVHQVHQGHDPP
jgi:hypothetical protein